MSSTNGKWERQSGTELLRMLAGMAVIVLHFNFHPAGGGAAAAAQGIGQVVLLLLESFCICAVNVFILISGYFGCTSKTVRISRLFLLLLQTSVFSCAVVVISCLIAGQFDLRRVLGALLPVNYYVILYVTMMALSPFINSLIGRLSDKAFRILLLMVLFFFSLAATGVEVLKEITGTPLAGLNPVGLDGAGAGYTIVQFILIYLLGAYIRRSDAERRFAVWKLLAVLAGCPILLYLWRLFLPGTAWIYCNPLVILEAVTVFLLFSRMKFQSRWINRIAPASFTCYLIHEPMLGLLDLSAVGKMPIWSVAGVLVLSVIAIYAASVLIMKAWNMLVGMPLGNRIQSWPVISAE